MTSYPYITVYECLIGWKSVKIDLVHDHCGVAYEEPLQTGFTAYPTREEAVSDGLDWAFSEGLEFKE